MQNINKELKEYIEKNIFPSYEQNDQGHKIDHIKYVIERSLKFAGTISEINLDMVYTIAAYHDIGHYIDAKNHEKVSSEILLKDENLKRFFTENEINIMSEAVYDHRACLEAEPRSIYGKIVSSADRNTFVDLAIKRAYTYSVKHNPNLSFEQRLKECREYILNKFGPQGFASEKMYFEDAEYITFLRKINNIVQNEEMFKKIYTEISENN